MKKILVTNTMERQDMTGPELAEFIQKDVAHWAEQVESAGLKAQ
jgi:tripartite-type tricarboxylate transporter receptor subunit TctC